MMARKAAPKIDKHETLGRLLTDYGLEAINAEGFEAQMSKHGFTQPDIDAWCAEEGARRNDGGEQDRPARAAVAGHAGGEGRAPIKVRKAQGEGDRQ
jgi:hypothetical protein